LAPVFRNELSVGAALAPDSFRPNLQVSLRLYDRWSNLAVVGTGDAGKSTFAKQMKVIHKDGFSKQEIERFTDILRDNCLVAMQVPSVVVLATMLHVTVLWL